MVRYARSLVFQLAEVMARRVMFDKILERIARLRPGYPFIDERRFKKVSRIP